MKKIRLSILTVVAVMALHSAYGQVAIGLKGGLNFANIDTSTPSTAYNSRTGYHAGAFVSFKFTKIAIQPELVYSQQGTTVQYNGASIDQNFSYVNVPILLKLYLVGGLNLQLGPQFGFLTAASGPIPGSGSSSSQDIKSYYKSSDISIALGAGIDLPLNLNLDFRYNLGVSDNNESTASTVKNQVFQLSVGFKLFKIGG